MSSPSNTAPDLEQKHAPQENRLSSLKQCLIGTRLEQEELDRLIKQLLEKAEALNSEALDLNKQIKKEEDELSKNLALQLANEGFQFQTKEETLAEQAKQETVYSDWQLARTL
jgi:uncharacterized coiled-coil protein SlyX